MNAVTQPIPFCAAQGPRLWDFAAFTLRPSNSVDKRLIFGSQFWQFGSKIRYLLL